MTSVDRLAREIARTARRVTALEVAPPQLPHSSITVNGADVDLTRAVEQGVNAGAVAQEARSAVAGVAAVSEDAKQLAQDAVAAAAAGEAALADLDARVVDARADLEAAEAALAAAQAAVDTLTTTTIPQLGVDLGLVADDAAAAKAAADAAITAHTVEYAQGTSATVPPATGWSTTAPTHVDGEYLWMRTIVTYGDGSTATSGAVLVTGNTGPAGEDGAPGQDGAPGEPGQDGAPGQPGADGAPGADGQDGAPGVSVTAIQPYFRLMLTGSTPAQPTASTPTGWQATEPDYQAQRELWRTERIAYSNGTWAYTPVTKVSAYTAAVTLKTALDANTARLDTLTDVDLPALLSRVTTVEGGVELEGKRLTLSESAPGSATGYPDGAYWIRVDSAGREVGYWRKTALGWTATTLSPTVIPSLDAGIITSGTINTARLSAAEIAAAVATIIELNADRITSGTINTARLNATEVAAAVGSFLSLNASQITTGTLNADRIASGSITTTKLASGAVTADKLTITSSAFMSNAVIQDLVARTAFIETLNTLDVLARRVIVHDADGNVKTQITGAAGDTLAIYDTTGAPAVALSDSGTVAARAGSFDQLKVAGTDIADYLRASQKGKLVALSSYQPSANRSTTAEHYADFGFGFDVEPHHTYRVEVIGGGFSATANARSQYFVFFGADGVLYPGPNQRRIVHQTRYHPAPTLTSPGPMVGVVTPSLSGQTPGNRRGAISFVWGVQNGSPAGARVYRLGSGTVPDSDIIILVYDEGPMVERGDVVGTAIDWNQETQPTPPATGGVGKVPFDVEFEATGFQSFMGNGAPYSGSGSGGTNPIQGQTPYWTAGGNQSSHIYFDSAAIAAQLSGATDVRMWAYVRMDHWHYSSGGRLRIHRHNYSSTQASRGTLTYMQDQWYTARGQAHWAEIPAGHVAAFLAGTAKGIGFWGAGTDPIDYGYASWADRPRLRITGVK